MPKKIAPASDRPRFVLAIDPGIGGAIALVDDHSCLAAFNMPIEQKRSGRKQVDALRLYQQIIELFTCTPAQLSETHALIEQVAARPGQGVSGMFSFGDSFGVARTVLAVTFERTEMVMPNVWKKAMGLTKDKAYSLTLARRSFPDARPSLTRKKDEGVAEALLLARYGQKYFRWA